MAAKFKAVKVSDLYGDIPGISVVILNTYGDLVSHAKFYDLLDAYAEQNNLEFFDLLHPKGYSPIAIFKIL